MEGFDYSFGWTPALPAALKAAGADFVVRYLGTSSKCLTAAEATGLHRAAIAIGLVHETTGVTFTGGAAAGRRDGAAAAAAAAKLGVPAGTPIWFAIDTDTSDYATVRDYLTGCAAGCGPYAARLYAGFHVIEAVGGGGHWQTYAWSGGQVSAHAGLYQYLNGHRVGGVDTDRCRTLAHGPVNTGGWLSYATAPAPAAKTPTPDPGGAPVTTAVSRARAEHTSPSQNWHDLCLRFVRICFGLDPDGHTPNAIDAWTNCPAGYRHPGDAHPPANVPVIWSGGSGGAGHAAVSAGGGQILSTDIARDGKVDEVALTLIHAKWGLSYKGWIEVLEGKRVYTAPARAKPPVVAKPPAKAPAGTKAPVVSLANVTAAAKADPKAKQGAARHAGDVKPVEAALHAEGLLDAAYVDGSFGTKTVAAYRAWQEHLGYTGSGADGVPGHASLTALGKRHGFTVGR